MQTATAPIKRKLLHHSNLKETASFESSSLKTEKKKHNEHKAINQIHQQKKPNA